MIKVWTDSAEAGMLDRQGERGSSFAYSPENAPSRAVSVTMPVRLPSWDTLFGLQPIFEMNLPEGVLRERLRLAFAKVTGTFDEFDLLGVVGRSQVGRAGGCPLAQADPADQGPGDAGRARRHWRQRHPD